MDDEQAEGVDQVVWLNNVSCRGLQKVEKSGSDFVLQLPPRMSERQEQGEVAVMYLPNKRVPAATGGNVPAGEEGNECRCPRRSSHLYRGNWFPTDRLHNSPELPRMDSKQPISQGEEDLRQVIDVEGKGQ